MTLDIGPFEARETVLQCPHDGSVYPSEHLRRLFPVRSTFSYDVLVYVGKALFVRNRTEEEICHELSALNITISDREIAYLGKKFVLYLALAHRESISRLRRAMIYRGGYILHVDGTCEGDSPHLFTGLDGLADIVLDTIKIPSEKAELLIPFFRRLKRQFGDPLVVVHDMGKGIIQAVREVFPDVTDLICHFHFLRDIGKDFLEDDYSRLRTYLQKEKVRFSIRQKARHLETLIALTPAVVEELITSLQNGSLDPSSVHALPAVTTYALIHWAFDVSGEVHGYGFPFDRSHLVFYQRLQHLRQLFGRVKTITQRGNRYQSNPFYRIWNYLDKIMNNHEIQTVVAHLEEKVLVFDRLRAALSIALFDGKRGLNDEGATLSIKTIEQKVQEFRDEICSHDDLMKQKDYQKMIQQIDTYWEKLFADPIMVWTPMGEVLIQPQRTNNILERFFRNIKRKHRKKSGSNSLNKALKAILEETPLIQNLDNHDYMRILLDGCITLEERFAKIESERVITELKRTQRKSDLMFPNIKKIIKNNKLPLKIEKLYTSAVQL